jgi:predicted phage-related endonuclease
MMAKRPLTLAEEVANASRVLTNELEAKQATPGRTNELVATAKRLERLQAKRRKVRAELRRIDADIRHEKKFLRALAGAVTKG